MVVWGPLTAACGCDMCGTCLEAVVARDYAMSVENVTLLLTFFHSLFVLWYCSSRAFWPFSGSEQEGYSLEQIRRDVGSVCECLSCSSCLPVTCTPPLAIKWRAAQTSHFAVRSRTSFSWSLVLALEVCRPNAIKWCAGQSISDRRPKPQQGKRQGGQAKWRGEDGNEEESSLLSEIRATELIREGEEIT